MFRKILIANRGEIAVRITQTLQQMGITAVAVYSDADRGAPHVALADEAYPLEGVTAAETYLRMDAILAVAGEHDVDAIHPGYGFLAENAAFAEACAGQGVTFIGPPPAAMRALGDKVAAKRIMAEAGVPVVPGFDDAADADPARLAAEAERIGYPVLVKAAAGGGGKGMRVVQAAGDLGAAVESASREAGAAFGHGRIFLEKYIERARHVEFQIFGDGHGAVVHLFERDCSVQRRHQKIIEETPAPALSEDVRRAMGEAAVRAARAIGYTNAGTVEFLLDDAGRFHFLEVNARLQVEHPITEMTLRRDLVEMQVRVAAGEHLPFAQSDLRPEGHAIECRICAEDPGRDFLPSTGTIEVYDAPAGPNVRVDSGVRAGSVVTVHYDPMLAKLIVWGGSRDEAIARALHALDRFVIAGVTTNVDLLRRVLEHDAFAAGGGGRVHTRFLEEHRLGAPACGEAPAEALVVAAAAVLHPGWGRLAGDGPGAALEPGAADAATGGGDGPWRGGGAWRIA